MNRPYTINDYIKLVRALRSEFKAKRQGLDKELAISTDIIVGFPGETKKAFENTKKAMEKLSLTWPISLNILPAPSLYVLKK